MSYSSSASLPALPTEVKTHILRFCDPATLAVTSRVSLAFLELSVPILHDDIHIEGLENMQKLFCSRAGSPPSALDGILSLRHVRALTIVSTEHTTPGLMLSHDRIDQGSSVVVSNLTLGLGIGWDSRWDSLTPMFDPETVRIYVVEDEPGDYADLDFSDLPWHRLRSTELSLCLALGFLGAASPFERGQQTEDLNPLAVMFYFPGHRWRAFFWEMVLENMGEQEPDLDIFCPSSRLVEVVVRVSTETDKERATVMQMEAFKRVNEPERTRRLALIRYEVANPTVAVDSTAT